MAGAFCRRVSNIDYERHCEIVSYFAKSVSPVVIKIQSRIRKSL